MLSTLPRNSHEMFPFILLARISRDVHYPLGVDVEHVIKNRNPDPLVVIGQHLLMMFLLIGFCISCRGPGNTCDETKLRLLDDGQGDPSERGGISVVEQIKGRERQGVQVEMYRFFRLDDPGAISVYQTATHPRDSFALADPQLRERDLLSPIVAVNSEWVNIGEATYGRPMHTNRRIHLLRGSGRPKNIEERIGEDVIRPHPAKLRIVRFKTDRPLFRNSIITT